MFVRFLKVAEGLKGCQLIFKNEAVSKLQMLHAASRLEDLKVPPGNRLETLKGNRKDQHSIRINDQFRVCFVWRSGDAFDVEIVDYHT